LSVSSEREREREVGGGTMVREAFRVSEVQRRWSRPARQVDVSIEEDGEELRWRWRSRVRQAWEWAEGKSRVRKRAYASAV
jgi:hypothetical protein